MSPDMRWAFVAGFVLAALEWALVWRRTAPGDRRGGLGRW